MFVKSFKIRTLAEQAHHLHDLPKLNSLAPFSTDHSSAAALASAYLRIISPHLLSHYSFSREQTTVLRGYRTISLQNHPYQLTLTREVAEVQEEIGKQVVNALYSLSGQLAGSQYEMRVYRLICLLTKRMGLPVPQFSSRAVQTERLATKLEEFNLTVSQKSIDQALQFLEQIIFPLQYQVQFETGPISDGRVFIPEQDLDVLLHSALLPPAQKLAHTLEKMSLMKWQVRRLFCVCRRLFYLTGGEMEMWAVLRATLKQAQDEGDLKEAAFMVFKMENLYGYKIDNEFKVLTESKYFSVRALNYLNQPHTPQHHLSISFQPPIFAPFHLYLEPGTFHTQPLIVTGSSMLLHICIKVDSPSIRLLLFKVERLKNIYDWHEIEKDDNCTLLKDMTVESKQLMNMMVRGGEYLLVIEHQKGLLKGRKVELQVNLLGC